MEEMKTSLLLAPVLVSDRFSSEGETFYFENGLCYPGYIDLPDAQKLPCVCREKNQCAVFAAKQVNMCHKRRETSSTQNVSM